MKHLHRLLTIALLVVISAACNQEELPTSETETPLNIPAETPAAEKLTVLIEAIRTGDRSVVKDLIRTNMAGFLQEIPIDDHARQLLKLYPGMSHIIFHDFTRNEPYAVEGLFRNTHTDEWVKIAVEVEEEPPHRIYLIGLEPASAPTPAL